MNKKLLFILNLNLFNYSNYQQPQVIYQQPVYQTPQPVYVQQQPLQQPEIQVQQPQVSYQQPQVIYQQPNQPVYTQPYINLHYNSLWEYINENKFFCFLLFILSAVIFFPFVLLACYWIEFPAKQIKQQPIVISSKNPQVVYVKQI